jgi:hypothetical protein
VDIRHNELKVRTLSRGAALERTRRGPKTRRYARIPSATCSSSWTRRASLARLLRTQVEPRLRCRKPEPRNAAGSAMNASSSRRAMVPAGLSEVSPTSLASPVKSGKE